MSIAEKFEVIADAVYEKGKSDKESDFWDYIQNYGKRTNYDHAFKYWGGETLRPKHKVVPTNAHKDRGFELAFASMTYVKKLEAEYFDLSGLGLPTDSSTRHYRQTFQNCSNLEHIEDIGMQPARYYYTFNGCHLLHTIDVLRAAENTQFTEAFGNCLKLENITIEGTIGQSINFNHSPLSITSLISIITHLKNYAGSENAGKYTITFKDACKTLLAEHGELAELGNKTYDQYIADIGWELD